MRPCHVTAVAGQLQRGAAVLILLAMIVLAGGVVLMGALANANPQLARDKITATALAQAKEALLGWAASNSGLPGQLPCPEDTALIGTAGEGAALGVCAPPVTGRLPWRTLGLPEIRDGNGDQLWYALSAGFRAAPINSATPAQLTLDGIPNSAVAILFSPGAALNGQLRPAPTAAAPPDPTRYLDLLNSGGGNAFASSGPVATFNDKLAVLAQAELMRVVEARAAGEVAKRLRAYYALHFYFPYAAQDSSAACVDGATSGITPLLAGACSHPAFPASLPAPLNAFPPWHAANGWAPLIAYQVASGCVQTTPGTAPPALPECGAAGRIAVGANDAVRALLSTAGNPNFIVAP
jgi:hypothetical protein